MWQYDADGRLLIDGTLGTYTYDAAGRNITLATPISTATIGRDGDGQQIKTVEADARYYVRSTRTG